MLFVFVQTSELYKRLGGTGSLVETFHSSVALFLVQELPLPGPGASAQLPRALLSSGSVMGSGGLHSGPMAGKRVQIFLYVCFLRNWAARAIASLPD